MEMKELIRKVLERHDEVAAKDLDKHTKFFTEDCNIRFFAKVAEKGDWAGQPKYTVCVVQNKHEPLMMGVGIASMSHKDEWNDDLGKTVALTKAIRDWF